MWRSCCNKIPRIEADPITVDMVESRITEGTETNGKRLIHMCGYNNANWGNPDYFENRAYASISDILPVSILFLSILCSASALRNQGAC